MTERSELMTTRTAGRPRAPLLLAVLAAALSADDAAGQEIRGRVLDERTDLPVATALVRLVEEGGESMSVTLADSAGVYRLRVPGPGTFRLQAERIGYSELETPLLRAVNPEAVYPLDLLMTPAPVELEGFTIETDRVPDEQVDRSVRQMIGVSIASMRYRPIRFDQIQAHIESGRVLEDVVRWEARAGLLVRRTLEGTCYEMRGACVPVYLNGVRVNQLFTGDWPLDMVYTIVLVSPKETIAYPGGAILLYTEGWVR